LPEEAAAGIERPHPDGDVGAARRRPRTARWGKDGRRLPSTVLRGSAGSRNSTWSTVIDSPPVRPPVRRHRRRPSRAVRLRRTITVAVALTLFAVTGTHFLGRDDAVPAVDVLPTAGAKPSPQVKGGAAAESVAAQDGTSATDTRSSGAVAVLQRGTGKLTVLTVPPAKARATGRTVTYTVEIEGGLPVDRDEVATTVQTVLLDPQGPGRTSTSV
jgi:hypothetical protein